MMYSNKKVRGAKKVSYEGVKFDSALEVKCYKRLKEADIKFDYSTYRFTLCPSMRLSKVSYVQNTTKKEFKEMVSLKGLKRVFQAMTYTPDFFITDPALLSNKIFVFIETKGKENDVYPYKRKLFFNFMETTNGPWKGKVWFYEPRNEKQIKMTVESIKQLIDETKHRRSEGETG